MFPLGSGTAREDMDGLDLLLCFLRLLRAETWGPSRTSREKGVALQKTAFLYLAGVQSSLCFICCPGISLVAPAFCLLLARMASHFAGLLWAPIIALWLLAICASFVVTNPCDWFSFLRTLNWVKGSTLCPSARKKPEVS